MTDANAYTLRVRRVTDYVRKNLDASLDLTTLARVAHFSPHHFHRVFKSVTGETLTRFVQRARLERAAYLMKGAPSRKLDSIALEVGFAAHSDFTRVFKRHYGVAPSTWDRRSRLDEVTLTETYAEELAEAHRLYPAGPVELSSEPARRLLYVRTQTPFLGEPLHRAYGRLRDHLAAHDVDLATGTWVGWCWDHYETTPLDQIYYDLGFTVPERIEAEGEFALQQFPAHRSAAVKIDGPLASIAVAWDALFDAWLPTSRFEPDDLPAMKVFDGHPDAGSWSTYTLRCTLPVRPRVG